MKRSIFLLNLIIFSTEVQGMNNMCTIDLRESQDNTQSSDNTMKKAIVSNFQSRAENTPLDRRNNPVDYSIGLVNQNSNVCRNQLAEFLEKEPRDIADLLVSIGNVMNKQNFHYKTELEQVINKEKQAQSELNRLKNVESYYLQELQRVYRLHKCCVEDLKSQHLKDLQDREIYINQTILNVEQRHRNLIQQKDQKIKDLSDKIKRLEESKTVDKRTIGSQTISEKEKQVEFLRYQLELDSKNKQIEQLKKNEEDLVVLKQKFRQTAEICRNEIQQACKLRLEKNLIIGKLHKRIRELENSRSTENVDRGGQTEVVVPGEDKGGQTALLNMSTEEKGIQTVFPDKVTPSSQTENIDTKYEHKGKRMRFFQAQEKDIEEIVIDSD